MNKSIREWLLIRLRKINAKLFSRFLILRYFPLNHGPNRFFLPYPSLHRPTCESMLGGELYEPATHEFIHRYLHHRPGNIIHAGAYFGDMLPSFSKAVGLHNNVYTFEPVIDHYHLLTMLCNANSLENVCIFNAALTEHTGTIRIVSSFRGIALGGGSYLTNDLSGKITTALSLDFLRLSNISLIHLDLEGSELNALKGACKLINTNKPCIIVEDNSRACHAFLVERGYLKYKDIPCNVIYVHNSDSFNG